MSLPVRDSGHRAIVVVAALVVVAAAAAGCAALGQCSRARDTTDHARGRPLPPANGGDTG